MSFLTVDPAKCRRDGACVAECPARIIVLRDVDAVPTAVADADQFCIKCGHCVAVCPHGALALDTLSPEQCPPVRPEWLLDPERIEHLLRARRSIRAYKPRPVPRETLARLIAVARYAPTGSNRQPVRWLVVHDPDLVRRLAELEVEWLRSQLREQPELALAARWDRLVADWDAGYDRICRGAPHVVVAYAPKDRGATDCVIALTYLELAAPAFGLGACWGGYLNMGINRAPAVREELGLPADCASYGAMMVGYPRYEYHRLPPRDEPAIAWR